MIHGADALVTWNMADIARPKMRRVASELAGELGIQGIPLGTPQEILRWLESAIRSSRV
jgi:hypothetical protein